jgi:threonine/homoserine/homoserine lactone efflux protein
MLDPTFTAYIIMAAALVISPGASMAVVAETALERGRSAALTTVLGINIANSSLALASMFGLSALFHQWPSFLRAVSIGGAMYLTCLGVQALWRNADSPDPAGVFRSKSPSLRTSSALVRGIMTNLLNPSVVLFYTLLLPQFVRNTDPFVSRFLLLAVAHISMSLLWLSTFAMAVGSLSENMARPRVRRTMEILTGAILVVLGIRLILK